MWQRYYSLTLILAFLPVLSLTQPARSDQTPRATEKPAQQLLDLNTATPAQLQELPGVGEATANKIIAGRPYKSVDELAKAGVPKATIDKIQGMVTVKPVSKSAATEEKPRPGQPEGKHRAKLDLNTATAEELQTLPGLSGATARKVIAGRPYKSVDDLARAGVPKASIDKIRDQVTVQPAARHERVNLNTATAEELKDLPGVGDAMAKKIMAGRPYKSVDDLKKAGVPKATIDKFRDEVTVRSAQARGGKINLNTASAAELEELRGVGDATARKIIAGRPYRSVSDLTKAGVPEATVARIRDAVTVESGTAAAPPKRGPTIQGNPVGPAKPGEGGRETVTPRTPPQPGMVWVNTETGVFHQPGSHWYGATKEGKFMTQADAEKAGYHQAKNE